MSNLILSWKKWGVVNVGIKYLKHRSYQLEISTWIQSHHSTSLSDNTNHCASRFFLARTFTKYAAYLQMLPFSSLLSIQKIAASENALHNIRGTPRIKVVQCVFYIYLINLNQEHRYSTTVYMYTITFRLLLCIATKDWMAGESLKLKSTLQT